MQYIKSLLPSIGMSSQKRHYLYMLREREFFEKRPPEPVYKIGKTESTDPNVRLRSYPKGGELVMISEVENCHVTEKKLMATFDKAFKRRRDIGREYYEGERNKMRRTFLHVIDEEFTEPYIEPGERPGILRRAGRAVLRVFQWN